MSHPFFQICSKHLFAAVELHDAVPHYHVASSKKGFVKYIRKLTYKVSFNNRQRRSSALILPNFLRTISRLNCLTINASKLDWNTLDFPLTSAFLHLMHLFFSTINHIDLSLIQNFPLSSLTLSICIGSIYSI